MLLPKPALKKRSMFFRVRGQPPQHFGFNEIHKSNICKVPDGHLQA